MKIKSRLETLGQRLCRSRWSPLRTVVGFRTEEPLLALTFDDGPDPEYTPTLLDILERHGAQATFFMVGHEAEQHPDIVREVAERGHAIGNHTYTHPSLPAMSGRRRRSEIRRCAEALSPYATRMLRPPQGHQSVASRLDALRCRHEVVGWSVDADDWNPHEAEWIAARLLDRISPGAIVLLHDGLQEPSTAGAADRSAVLEAVEMVLDTCSHRYECLPLPSLLERARPIREGWFRDPGDTWE